MTATTGVTSSSAANPRVGIVVVGVGDIGSTLAPLLASAGHEVVLASRRTREELADGGLGELLQQPGVRVAPVPAGAEHADVVLLSVPFGRAAQTLDQLGELSGRIVIDATNFNRDRDGDDVDPGAAGTTVVLAERFPAARWVKSFNMLWAGYLRADAKPAGQGDRVVFVAADDAEAKATVADLIRDAGFVPFDTGGLGDSVDRQVEGTPAWNQRLTFEQAARLLPGAPGAMPAGGSR